MVGRSVQIVLLLSVITVHHSRVQPTFCAVINRAYLSTLGAYGKPENCGCLTVFSMILVSLLNPKRGDSHVQYMRRHGVAIACAVVQIYTK